MKNSYINLDDEKGYGRYIYSNIREEERYLWRAAVTVLGIVVAGIGVILSKNIPYGNLIATQLIWIGGIAEIMILTDFNNKRKFLIEIELEDNQSKGNDKIDIPYFESWVNEHQFNRFGPYNISIVLIVSWAYLSFFWFWTRIERSTMELHQTNVVIDVVLMLEASIAFILAVIVAYNAIRIGSK